MRTSDAMQRHDFDPVAFIFGVLFTGSGILFMIGRFDLFNQARWLWPGLLVLLGIAVLVGARGRGSQGRERAVQSAATEPVLDVPDLDSIEPPVGPEAFRLPGWPPKGGERTAGDASTRTESSEPASTSSEPASVTSEATARTDTDVLEPAERETEVIDEPDPEAETRPLHQRRPSEDPPASG
jgi:hypothetical protein